MKNKPIDVTILGGGVIGVTTGIILNLHGYKTKIYTARRVDEVHPYKIDERQPELASIHAAASIIPHSVNHPNEKDILSISQKFFHRLAFSGNFGVRMQRHYELHEYKPDMPEYARAVMNFTQLAKDGTSWVNDPNIPRRKNAKQIYGWHFNAFFASVPIYMKRLYEMYEASRGSIVQKEIKSIEELKSINSEVIINCLGRWAVELFPEDKQYSSIHRGHMVKVDIHEVPHDHRGQYFSYNYSPDSSIYHRKVITPIVKDEMKSPADVYFYPRSDGWLLGGSRQEGFPDIGADWNGEEISGERFKKPEWKFEVPKAIWDLNRELILEITNPKIDIADDKYHSHSYIGYRFKTNPVRLKADDSDSNSNRFIIHNYGHGGAGYTLSWGSAFEVIKIIESEMGILSINKRQGFRKQTVTSSSVTQNMLSILEDLIKKEYLSRNGSSLL